MNSLNVSHSGATSFEAWTPDGTCYARVSIHGATLGVQLEPDIRELTGQQVAERLIACNDVAYLNARLAAHKVNETEPHLRGLEGLDETQAALDAATHRLHRYATRNDPPAGPVTPSVAGGNIAVPATTASLDNGMKVAFTETELDDYYDALDNLIKKLSDIKVQATDVDNVVAMTLGCDGRLVRLWIDDGAPSWFTHLELEAKVDETMRHALAEVQTAWNEITDAAHSVISSLLVSHIQSENIMHRRRVLIS